MFTNAITEAGPIAPPVIPQSLLASSAEKKRQYDKAYSRQRRLREKQRIHDLQVAVKLLTHAAEQSVDRVAGLQLIVDAVRAQGLGR